MGILDRVRRGIGNLFRPVSNIFNRKKPAPPFDRAGAMAKLQAHVARYQIAVARYSAELVADRMSMTAFQELLWNAIKEVYTTAAVAAAGGLQWMGQEQLSRLNKVLQEQRPYFVEFMNTLERTPQDKLSAAYIQRRALMYTDNAAKLIDMIETQQFPGLPELPFYPKEASLCGRRCYCKWSIKDVDPARGDWDCTWVLDRDKDNCETCVARAAVCKPLQIRGWSVPPLRRTNPELWVN